MKERFSLIVCLPVDKKTTIYLTYVVTALRVFFVLLFKKKSIVVSEPSELDGDTNTIDYRVTVSW